MEKQREPEGCDVTHTAGLDPDFPNQIKVEAKMILSDALLFIDNKISLSANILELLGPLLRLELCKETAKQVCKLPAYPLVPTQLLSVRASLHPTCPREAASPALLPTCWRVLDEHHESVNLIFFCLYIRWDEMTYLTRLL